MKTFAAAGLFALAVIADPAAAAEADADKRGFHLFNPTPRALMREMSTDRPDTTESAYTVDAGHVQLEMSFANYTHDDRNSDDSRVETLEAAPMNLKVGLLNNVDLQLVLTPHVRETTHDQSAHTSGTAESFGDAIVRVKVNLWGNDGGDTALAVMPFIKFPTADEDLGNDHLEGGLIVPLAIALPHEFSLGLMAEIDAVYDDEDENYDAEFVHTATVGHDLIGDLAGYLEYIGVVTSDEDSDYRTTLGGGLTYAVTENIQLDAGANFGLNKAADDVNVFIGLSVRY